MAVLAKVRFVKKKKVIESVNPIFNQTLREVIRDCDLNILKIANLTKLGQGNLYRFCQGKTDIQGTSISKILEILPEKSQKQFSELLLKKIEEQKKNTSDSN